MTDSSALLSRRVLVLFVLVAGFTMAELGWWVYFNVRSSTEQMAALRAQSAQDRQLASELVMLRARLPGARADTPVELLRQYFPNLEWRGGMGAAGSAGGGVSHGVAVRQSYLQAMQARHDTRVRMFLWEGGFFLVTLMIGIALILRTLRREVGLRRQQANFLSAVTHELKSPLASIRLYAETMTLRDPPLEKRSRYLKHIQQDVARLETLVGNLLAVARLEARRPDVEARQSSDLAADLEQLLAPYRTEIGERGGTLEVLLPDAEQEVRVAYDPGALRTVVRNLLDNAIKYGGEKLQVRVQLSKKGRYAVLEISDAGIGLPSGEHERIFGKFYRVGDEMVRQAEGSGLGLFLVRELVRQHGGDVMATSRGIGCGTTFRVTWPLSEPNEAENVE